MADFILLSVREANLLRNRLGHLLSLRDELVGQPDEETVHDLRVSSRRAREILDYLQTVLPPNVYQRMRGPARNITSRLGELRETEVNLKLSEELHQKSLIPPVAAELLMHSLTKRRRKLQQKVNKQMKSRNFSAYRKFLSRLKGSRSVLPVVPEVLRLRAEDFYNFTLHDEVNDEQLHELRILTKKFRYALEISNRLLDQKIGRFILRLKRLQELLGEIHDLFVFANLVKKEASQWDVPGLKIIPEALDNAIRVVSDQKQKLYPRLRVFYQRVLDHTPEGIRPAPRKEIHSAESPVAEVRQTSPANSFQKIS
jgi:CHAD domain-containing protein